VRRFVDTELAPRASEWEDDKWFPNSVFERLAELGWLGLKYPEEYGGEGGDYLHDAVFTEELSRCGSGGLAAGIGAHIGIATPPVWKFGTEDQKQRFLAPAIRGEKIAALGITEPDAGSDVASIRTRANRVDGGYVVNGSKTFITNGVRADFVVTAVKTTDEGGHHGISFLVVEKGMEGFSVSRKLEKMGWHAVRHRRAGLPGRVRARGEPARPGEPGLLPDHGQLPVGAIADVARHGRRDGEAARDDDRLREGASGVRAPDRQAPGHPPQDHRHGGQARARPRGHLQRAAPVQRRATTRSRKSPPRS
jgi:hypothetical protein